jgi:predicted RNase H-like HicB family nuclease
MQLSAVYGIAFMEPASIAGTGTMGRLIVVRATWDEEASVWVAESSDLPGLITEAASIDELDAKLPALIWDLLDDGSGIASDVEIPIEVIASYSKRIRGPAKAA